MARIKVPKTPRKAFDPSRPASTLLLGQIAHLEWAVLPASQRKPEQLPKKKVKTEGAAAARVAQLTEMVLQAARDRAAAGEITPSPAQAFAPVKLPPVVGSRTRPKASRSGRKGRRR